MDMKRSSGILLHPTSLPNKLGIGTIGKEAYEFVNFLVKSGQSLWQTLPLGPLGYGDSPYACFSAFAGSPLLISLEKLQEQGFLDSNDLNTNEEFSNEHVEYEKVMKMKYPLLLKAYHNFLEKGSIVEHERFKNFCRDKAFWLDDFSLFMTIKNENNGVPWFEWEHDLKFRSKNKISEFKEKHCEQIEYQKYMQYEFFRQWEELKTYANDNGIKIIGDIPVYVAHDSSDAWSHHELFQFDKNRNPVGVAGVPPDYFSATGQLWGNPLFNWKYLKKTGFKWWIERIKANLNICDIIRIDHFRGLSAFWSIPYGETTAINGQWVPAPGKHLFKALGKKLGKLPIIAEDLGFITSDVEELRDYFELPGMKILQFAFDSEEDSSHNFLPHVYDKRFVVYTGTHDNDTVLGWYNNAKDKDREYAIEYLQIDTNNVSWSFLRGAWASTANFALAPLQDILGLGTESRMNTPGILGGNWEWRVNSGILTEELAKKLRNLTEVYKRI